MTDLTPSGSQITPEEPSEEAKKLRVYLGEVGQQYKNVIKSEVAYIIPERDGTHSVYINRKGIHQVVGIYRATDIDKTKNLYIGNGSVTDPEGEFKRRAGVITLSPSFNYQELEKVFVDYVHQEGITDEDLDYVFEMATSFIRMETQDFSLEFTYGSNNWNGAIEVARYMALLLLSTGGLLQQGYNIRIENFNLESKAWGEGMIAQFLWQRYGVQLNEILAGFGCGVRASKSSRTSNFGSFYTGDVKL